MPDKRLKPNILPIWPHAGAIEAQGREQSLEMQVCENSLVLQFLRPLWWCGRAVGKPFFSSRSLRK
jgi:hypothetical protein